MKRIILGLLLIAASTQLKAQHLIKVVPDIKLNDGLQNYFKPKATPTPQRLLLQPNNDNQITTTNSNAIIIYSNMPVVKVSSTDRMPVAVLGNSNTNYTMLIKKVEINPAPVAPAP